MCGIVGLVNPGENQEKINMALHQMVGKLVHRGPDDSGVWFDEGKGIGLGHCRLSIVDLSPHGHQPMSSSSGRYYISYNGEVYNYQDLMKELELKNYFFKGHSDTVVMLAAIEEWGLEKAIERFIGMFAFALYDRRENILHLVRDRMGIKPIYYGWIDNSFVFSSELKAFKGCNGFKGKIDRNSLTLLMRHNYIPAPYSIYENIYKLEPGQILTLHCASMKYSVTTFWDLRNIVKKNLSSPLLEREEDIVQELEILLRDAVKLRMVADVPLGAFLSGGIDSSTVVALMQTQSQRSVKTFSIGFYEEGYNEANHAKEVASYLGTDHTELYITPEEAMSVIPKLPYLYDEPFSDSSQIPTFLVSQLAKRHVTVSLSGDGGDELFCGYDRYRLFINLWNKISLLPPSGRKMLSYAISALPGGFLNAFNFLSSFVNKYGSPGNLNDKLHKLAEIIEVSNPQMLYLNLVSHWKHTGSLVIGGEEPHTNITNKYKWANLPDLVAEVMYLDMISYLPDDILVKVDRASMGVSLEARVPLLDHRVVEFAWRVPQWMKTKENQDKWILRQILYKYVPKELIERPKMGFGVPIGKWLCGPLREWAESLLNESRIRQEGFFEPKIIRKKWLEHISGEYNWQYLLWDVLMFQAWLENSNN